MDRLPTLCRPGALLALLVALGTALSGCGTATARADASQVPVETGIASWYGRAHHGRATASGEPFDMHAMTAAHRSLPFGSHVRVRHLGNGREVVVRINDRGPFRRGRIIDLSRAAARALRIDGLAKVEVQPLAPHEAGAAGAR